MLNGLAPLFAAAGFVATPANPVGSTLAPFLLFLFLRNRKYPVATSHALRTADFAFSMHIYLLLAKFGVSLLYALGGAWTPPDGTMTVVVAAFLIYFAGMIIADFVQGLRGLEFRYPLSFRMAERVFEALERRQQRGA
jgi:hypothetical protein